MKILDLEVHVCTKSGAVVTAVKPTIAVQAAAGRPRTYPSR